MATSINLRPDLSFTVKNNEFVERKVQNSTKKAYTFDVVFQNGETMRLTAQSATLEIALESIEVFARQVGELEKEAFCEFKTGSTDKTFHMHTQAADKFDRVTTYQPHRLRSPKNVFDYAFHTQEDGSRCHGMARELQINKVAQGKINDLADLLTRFKPRHMEFELTENRNRPGNAEFELKEDDVEFSDLESVNDELENGNFHNVDSNESIFDTDTIFSDNEPVKPFNPNQNIQNTNPFAEKNLNNDNYDLEMDNMYK